MPKIWFTSDLHFWHKNILKYCDRPFSNVKEMNNKIIRNYNSKVGDNDTVYILGDIAMGKREASIPLVKRLNGNKILILGNHDNSVDKERWISEFGFSAVWDYYITQHSGDYFVMAHDPVDTLFIARNVGFKTEPILLNGHVHDLREFSTDDINNRFSLNVGIDVNNYFPMSHSEVLERWVDTYAKLH